MLSTSDIPKIEDISVTSSAVDSVKIGSLKVQNAIDNLLSWVEKWNIEFSESKCIYNNFTKTHHHSFQNNDNNVTVPRENGAYSRLESMFRSLHKP